MVRHEERAEYPTEARATAAIPAMSRRSLRMGARIGRASVRSFQPASASQISRTILIDWYRPPCPGYGMKRTYSRLCAITQEKKIRAEGTEENFHAAGDGRERRKRRMRRPPAKRQPPAAAS